MLIKITGRHVELTEALRSYAEKKAGRVLHKYNRISEIEVIFDNEGAANSVEIIVKVDNHQRFVVRHAEEDAYAGLDVAIDKIERQLIRYKEKSRNHKGRSGAAEATAEIMDAKKSTEEGK